MSFIAIPNQYYNSAILEVFVFFFGIPEFLPEFFQGIFSGFVVNIIRENLLSLETVMHYA